MSQISCSHRSNLYLKYSEIESAHIQITDCRRQSTLDRSSCFLKYSPGESESESGHPWVRLTNTTALSPAYAACCIALQLIGFLRPAIVVSLRCRIAKIGLPSTSSLSFRLKSCCEWSRGGPPCFVFDILFTRLNLPSGRFDSLAGTN